jgi:hypothetical protein
MASARLEERVAALEAAVAPVKSKLEERDTITSRWEPIAGSFRTILYMNARCGSGSNTASHCGLSRLRNAISLSTMPFPAPPRHSVMQLPPPTRARRVCRQGHRSPAGPPGPRPRTWLPVSDRVAMDSSRRATAWRVWMWPLASREGICRRICLCPSCSLWRWCRRSSAGSVMGGMAGRIGCPPGQDHR